MEDSFNTTIINTSELEAAKMLLSKRFPEIISGYLEDAEKYLQGIEEGIRRNDLDIIVKNAHPLKSSSAGLGMMSVSLVAKEIEMSARLKSPVRNIQALISPLNRSLDYARSKLVRMTS